MPDIEGAIACADDPRRRLVCLVHESISGGRPRTSRAAGHPPTAMGQPADAFLHALSSMHLTRRSHLTICRRYRQCRHIQQPLAPFARQSLIITQLPDDLFTPFLWPPHFARDGTLVYCSHLISIFTFSETDCVSARGAAYRRVSHRCRRTEPRCTFLPSILPYFCRLDIRAVTTCHLIAFGNLPGCGK